jgi:hypothetical protein
MEPDLLLELADDAAAEGEYESAFHLLMAALHLAEHRGDHDAVMRAGAAGRRIGVAVEAVVPPHRISRSEAKRRGNVAIFDQLDVHAEAVRLRVESAQEMARAGKARA